LLDIGCLMDSCPRVHALFFDGLQHLVESLHADEIEPQQGCTLDLKTAFHDLLHTKHKFVERARLGAAAGRRDS